MVFQFPSSVLVPFPKLVALAHRKTNGLLREISEASVVSISSDMKEVGIIIDKFGRPTINLSCDETDGNYRNFFAPLQYDSAKVLNMEDGILNLDGFPVLQLASHLLVAVTVTDGRHRIVSSDKAFGETIYDSFVLCSITKFKTATEMKVDSYNKSGVRPVVFESIHDALECIHVLPENTLDVEALKKKVVRVLKLSTQSHIDRFCKLLVHLFPRAKKLMDLHRDAKIFNQECIYGSNGSSFVSLMQESGRIQLRAYRYGLSSVLCDLKSKEDLQMKCILLSSGLSRRLSGKREKPKVLASVSRQFLNALKERVACTQRLDITEIPTMSAGVLRSVKSEFGEEFEDSHLVEVFECVFPEYAGEGQSFFKKEKEDSSSCRREKPLPSSAIGKAVAGQSEVVEIGTSETVAPQGCLLLVAPENKTCEKPNEVINVELSVKSSIDPRSTFQRPDLKNDNTHHGPHHTDIVALKRRDDASDKKSGPQEDGDSMEASKNAPFVASRHPVQRYAGCNAVVQQLVDEILAQSTIGCPTQTSNQANDCDDRKVWVPSRDHRLLSRINNSVPQPKNTNEELGDDLGREVSLDIPTNTSDDEEDLKLSTSDPENGTLLERNPKMTTVEQVTAVRRSKRLKSQPIEKNSEDVSPLKRKASETALACRPPKKKQRKRWVSKRNRKAKGSKRTLIAKEKPFLKGKQNGLTFEKAACGLKCLELATSILSKVVFIRIENNEDTFSRFERLPNQGPESIAFFDNRFVATGKTSFAMKKMSQITGNIKYVVCMADTDENLLAESVSDMSIVSSGVIRTESKYDSSVVFVKVYGLTNVKWKGSKTFETFYDDSIKIEQQTGNFLAGLWHLFDLNLKECTIFDFLLGFQDILKYPLALGFVGFYFKCLTKQQENSMMGTHCLDLLRTHVLKSCECGGHALLTEENEPEINQYEGVFHDCDGVEKQPFFLTVGAEDVCPFGRVITHTSLLLRKDVKNNVPSFVNDARSLCTSESNPETGFSLHRGAFLSKECAEALSKEDVPCDILFPKCFLIDTLSKIRHYENSLSPFDMRELYVSGITYRKLWLFFSNRSTASFFNEGNEGGEIDFTPRYMDTDFINKLYQKGFGSLVEEKMSLICCTLRPGEVDRISEELICSNCGAVELLTDYGQEYVHD